VIDAIREYRQDDCARGGRKRHLARLAARWILSTDRSWPYSFENICAVFDVEPDELRRVLARERDLGALAAAAPRRRRNLVLTGRSPRVNLRRRHATATTPAADACLRPASQVAREPHASADAR
jgi:hypothetical protein